MLSMDNVSPRTSGMFYKAMVMVVLLYRSKSWNVAPLALSHLKGFHNRAVMKMARKHRPQWRPDKIWEYPVSTDAQEEMGLHPIAHYAHVKQNSVAQFITTWPIFEFCREGERKRKRGTRRRQY